MNNIDDIRNCLIYQPFDLRNWALEDFDKKEKCQPLKEYNTIKDPVVENIYKLNDPIKFTNLNENNYGNAYENEYNTNYSSIYR